MSLNYVNGIDPRLKALTHSQDLEIQVPQGSAFTNKVVQRATNVSNNSVRFNFNSPNKNTLIDRRFYCRIRFQVEFIGIFNNTSPQVAFQPFPPVTFVPRAFPLASVTQGVNLSINGTAISSAYSDVFYAFQRYASPDTLFAYDLSQTPTQLDFYASNEGIEQLDAGGNPENVITPRHPHTRLLGGDDKQLPRSAFNIISYNSPVIPPTVPPAPAQTGTSTFVFEIVEPIMVSPLLFASSKLDSGFINVDNIGLTLNFGNLNRVCSIRSDLVFDSQRTTIVGTPELLMEFKNLNMVDEPKIPKIVRYKYADIDIFKKPFSDITVESATADTFFKTTLTSNAIELTVCPKKIYIYVARPKHIEDIDIPYFTDSFLPITSLSLSYLNISGQFANDSQNDLYSMSRKNGYQKSFQEFSGLAMTYNQSLSTLEGLDGRVGLVGGVICIDSTDLALTSTITSGMSISSQLQLTVNVFNQDDVFDVVAPELVIIVVNDAIMEISENKMTVQTGYINQHDVLAIRNDGEIMPIKYGSQLMGC